MALFTLLMDRQVAHVDHVLRRLEAHQIRSVKELQDIPLSTLRSIFFDSVGCTVTASILQHLEAIHAADQTDDAALPAWHIETLCRTPVSVTVDDIIEAFSEVFDEYDTIRARQRAGAHPWLCWSFPQRCMAAGIPWLAVNVTKAARAFSEPPQKMMRRAIDKAQAEPFPPFVHSGQPSNVKPPSGS